MKIIYKTLVGSQAYGTSIPTSDIDMKGIYVQPNDDILSFRYKEQVEKGKDECYYEIKRFLELAQSANPTILEMLFMHDKAIVETSASFEILRSHKQKFLTKKCGMSFGGYAVSQIRKARGLDKKMNWEKSKVTRKTPVDFCYIITPMGSVNIREWLTRQKEWHQQKQEYYGVSEINNAKDLYFIYPSKGDLGYHGIINEEETSNSLRLSSIPKEQIIFATPMSYNKDGYIKHCKDYREYQDWMANRNTQRYVDIKGHNQQIDGKNLLHCRRLLDMAMEIATDKTINVLRPNADELLKIRRGEVNLEEILIKAEDDLLKLNEFFEKTDLPEEVDRNFLNDLILEIRTVA